MIATKPNHNVQLPNPEAIELIKLSRWRCNSLHLVLH